MLRFVLYILFFLSGCAALIYQVIWERRLFTLLGVDLESITIIVSVFMFGLGLGGLVGGIIADWKPKQLLFYYVVIEIGVAIFGYFSSEIISFYADLASINNIVYTGFISFLILVLPTVLMGATFPILVKHVNNLDQNIGRSVGGLYFANTLGGALGAFLSGFIFLYVMNLDGAIEAAVILNAVTALTAFLVFRRQA
jgi:predicted membrane-bound spermidine synthase